MSELVDIGGGFKMASAKGAIEQAKDLLGLADLANKVKIGDAESTPEMLAVRQLKAHADLNATQGAEQRAKLDYVQKFAMSLPKLANENIDLAQEYLKGGIAAGLLPAGTSMAKSEDGKIHFAMPQADGSIKSFLANPRTPEEKVKIQDDLRKGWADYGKGWEQVAEFHRDFVSTIGMGTGAADQVAFYSAMKQLDRSVSVGVGQSSEAMTFFRNTLTSLKETWEKQGDQNAPMFGKVGSATRTNLINAFNTVYSNAKDLAVQKAKFYVDSASSLQVDGKLVLEPFGGIGYDQAMGLAPIEPKGAKRSAKTAPQPAPTPPTAVAGEGLPIVAEGKPKATQAGAPAAAAPAVKAAKKAAAAKPAASLNELLQQGLFQGGQSGR